MPTEGALKMNEQLLKKYLSGQLQKRDADAQNTRTLYPAQSTQKITIQDFNLLKVVGRGAFGKVMLVEKKDDKKIYALKSIKKVCYTNNFFF